jgi:hypothetical protein
MKSRILIAICAILILCGNAIAGPKKNTSTKLGPELDRLRFFTGNVQMGYYDGVGLHFSGTFANFAEGFPFGLRIGFGHAWIPCGDAVLARRIFIDQNTGGNGNARSKGSLWDYRFDLLYPVKLFTMDRAKVYGGVRYTDFNAYFEYIGGNETFDVINNEWGVGGGVESAFALSPIVDMIFSLGVDYYFRGELSGHDTYYRPDGNDLNSKENFTYADADAAINDPNVNARFMIGVAYRF